MSIELQGSCVWSNYTCQTFVFKTKAYIHGENKIVDNETDI